VPGLALLPGTTVDGKIIIRDADGASDFIRLQLRLGLGPRRAVEASRRHRASFVAFDLLDFAGDDLRGRPLQLRRLELEQLSPPSSLISNSGSSMRPTSKASLLNVPTAITARAVATESR
jgi:ATP-dependent DNA ligase